MPLRARRRLRLYWPFCHYGGWLHHFGPFSPYPMARPPPEEEKDYLKDYIEILREELKAAEEDMKDLEKTK